MSWNVGRALGSRSITSLCFRLLGEDVSDYTTIADPKTVADQSTGSRLEDKMGNNK